VTLRRGEIHWIEFPPSAAREQAGRRPAIIIRTDTSGSRTDRLRCPLDYECSRRPVSQTARQAGDQEIEQQGIGSPEFGSSLVAVGYEMSMENTEAVIPSQS
jgi:mRNA-degrading endonuclease toxin of MazEF toxin-antitoxin module